MQLLVTPVNYKNAIDLISLNTPIIAIGTKKFCERTNCYFSIKEIKKIISIKKNTKIYILINRIFFEKQISNLEKYLLDIVSLNKIDGIIFSDYSVPQILFEHKIKINLCYNPETLVTNYCQFNFFKKNNINNVFLSRELNKKQVFDICSKKQKMKIFIQASGYAFMMQSR
jgi:putative protease